MIIGRRLNNISPLKYCSFNLSKDCIDSFSPRLNTQKKEKLKSNTEISEKYLTIITVRE